MVKKRKWFQRRWNIYFEYLFHLYRSPTSFLFKRRPTSQKPANSQQNSLDGLTAQPVRSISDFGMNCPFKRRVTADEAAQVRPFHPILNAKPKGRASHSCCRNTRVKNINWPSVFNSTKSFFLKKTKKKTTFTSSGLKSGLCKQETCSLSCRRIKESLRRAGDTSDTLMPWIPLKGGV